MNAVEAKRQSAFLKGRAARLAAEGFHREASWLLTHAELLEARLADQNSADLAQLVDGLV